MAPGVGLHPRTRHTLQADFDLLQTCLQRDMGGHHELRLVQLREGAPAALLPRPPMPVRGPLYAAGCPAGSCPQIGGHYGTPNTKPTPTTSCLVCVTNPFEEDSGIDTRPKPQPPKKDFRPPVNHKYVRHALSRRWRLRRNAAVKRARRRRRPWPAGRPTVRALWSRTSPRLQPFPRPRQPAKHPPRQIHISPKSHRQPYPKRGVEPLGPKSQTATPCARLQLYPSIALRLCLAAQLGRCSGVRVGALPTNEGAWSGTTTSSSRRTPNCEA